MRRKNVCLISNVSISVSLLAVFPTQFSSFLLLNSTGVCELDLDSEILVYLCCSVTLDFTFYLYKIDIKLTSNKLFLSYFISSC